MSFCSKKQRELIQVPNKNYNTIVISIILAYLNSYGCKDVHLTVITTKYIDAKIIITSGDNQK